MSNQINESWLDEAYDQYCEDRIMTKTEYLCDLQAQFAVETDPERCVGLLQEIESVQKFLSGVD